MHASNLALLSVLVGSALVFGGCSSSDANTSGNSYGGYGGYGATGGTDGGVAGSGGTAGVDSGTGGSAGTAGSGGVSGGGGTAGTSGSAGTAGTGGASGSGGAGGSAGASGSGGTGGTGGSAGGAGGSAGTAGTGGAGGVAGSGGAGGAGGTSGAGGAGGSGGDPCLNANCDPVATCSVQNGAAVCTCPSGYTDVNNDGSSCLDINECQTNTDNCDANATCTNTTGSFTCTCNWPYYGDGTACTAPSDLNWDFEDWTYTDPPKDFEKSSASSFSLTDETSNVNDGAHSCNVTWKTQSNRDLTAAMYATASVGTEYTAHIWMLDNDPAGRARPFLSFYSSLTTSPTNSFSSNVYSADSPNWAEYTWTAAAPAGTAFVRGSVRFYDYGSNFTSATIYVDDFDLTQHVTFDSTDSTVDTLTGKPAAPPEIIASPLAVYTAVNDQGMLYAAMPPATGSTGDHFLIVWVGGVDPSSTIAMPWTKNGTVAAPAAGGSVFVLAQEQSNAYCEWDMWNTSSSSWAKVSNDCSGASNGVLEGTVDLVANLGVASAADVPGMLDYSALETGTNDGDSLNQSLQTPACSPSCDPNVDASEVLAMHRARLLVGRVQ